MTAREIMQNQMKGHIYEYISSKQHLKIRNGHEGISIVFTKGEKRWVPFTITFEWENFQPSIVLTAGPIQDEIGMLENFYLLLDRFVCKVQKYLSL